MKKGKRPNKQKVGGKWSDEEDLRLREIVRARRLDDCFVPFFSLSSPSWFLKADFLSIFSPVVGTVRRLEF